MNAKYDRNYKLTLSGPSINGELVIQRPFTIDFIVQRDSYSSVNRSTIRIFNLSEIHRNQIIHDQSNYSPFALLKVTLQAGYGDGPQWPVVFTGNANRAWSVREGVNFVTTIESFDGGDAFQNAVSNIQIPAGTVQKDVLEALLGDLIPYGVSIGAVSDFEGTLAKGASYSGNTIDLVRHLSNGNLFIDNLRANVLKPGDVIAGETLLINAASGLLNTPVKQQQILILELLFEPRLAIGTQVNVQSSTAATYNGYHQVVGIEHRATISSAVCGDAITILQLRAGTFDEVVSQSGL